MAEVRLICTKPHCPVGNGIRTFGIISAHEHMGYHVWNDTGSVRHFSSFCICNAYFLSHASASEHLAFQTTGYHRIQPLLLPFHPGVQYSEELCHSVEFRGIKLLRDYIQEYLIVHNGGSSNDRRGNNRGIGERVNMRPEIGYGQAREQRKPEIASPDFSHRTDRMYDNAHHGYDNHCRSVEQRGQRLPVITSPQLGNANKQDNRRPIYENDCVREPLGARRQVVTASPEYSNRRADDHYSGRPEYNNNKTRENPIERLSPAPTLIPESCQRVNNQHANGAHEHGGSRIRFPIINSPTFSNGNQLNNFRTSDRNFERNASNSEELPVPPTFQQTQFKRTRRSSVEILSNCQARDSSTAKKAKDVTIGKAQSTPDEERASHAQLAVPGTDGECSVIDNNLSYSASMESMKTDDTQADDSATTSGRCRKTAINPRIPVNSRTGLNPVEAAAPPPPAKKRRGRPPKFK